MEIKRDINLFFSSYYNIAHFAGNRKVIDKPDLVNPDKKSLENLESLAYIIPGYAEKGMDFYAFLEYMGDRYKFTPKDITENYKYIREVMAVTDDKLMELLLKINLEPVLELASVAAQGPEKDTLKPDLSKILKPLLARFIPLACDNPKKIEIYQKGFKELCEKIPPWARIALFEDALASMTVSPVDSFQQAKNILIGASDDFFDSGTTEYKVGPIQLRKLFNIVVPALSAMYKRDNASIKKGLNSLIAVFGPKTIDIAVKSNPKDKDVDMPNDILFRNPESFDMIIKTADKLGLHNSIYVFKYLIPAYEKFTTKNADLQKFLEYVLQIADNLSYNEAKTFFMDQLPKMRNILDRDTDAFRLAARISDKCPRQTTAIFNLLLAHQEALNLNNMLKLTNVAERIGISTIDELKDFEGKNMNFDSAALGEYLNKLLNKPQR